MREHQPARHRWVPRIGRGTWALVDQGVVSLGTFVSTVLLARVLSPAQFGTFALLYGAMLFLNTIHASFITYPLSIHGARLDRDGLGRAATAFLILALGLALLLAAVLTGAAWALGAPRVAAWAVAAHLAWQVQETVRRALLAQLRPRDAVTGDTLSYLGQAAVIGALAMLGTLSLEAAFAAMAGTSALAAATQLALIRPARPTTDDIRALGAVALKAGQWVVLANVFGAAIMQGLLWTLALTDGATGAAKLQAVITVMGATNPVMFGIANLVVPIMAGAGFTRGKEHAQREVLVHVLQGGMLLAPYYAVLLLWPGRVLGVAYGSSLAYSSLTMPLRLLAFAYLLVYLAHVGNAVLFGVERTRHVLTVQVVGMAVLVGAGLPLSALWGVTGAAAATLVVHAARAGVCLRLVVPRAFRIRPVPA